MIGQAEVDRVEGEFLEADASVKIAEAARDIARLNLEFTTLRALFDGTVSGPVLGEGNVAVADTTPLARIVSMDPMFVAFDVDQQTLLHLDRLSEKARSRAEGGAGFRSRWACLARTSSRAAARSMPRTTGSIRRPARLPGAVIPNPDRSLLPGMFVRVRLVTGVPHRGLPVPEQSLLTEGDRTSVFIVTGQNVVQRRRCDAAPATMGCGRSRVSRRRNGWSSTTCSASERA